MRTTVFFSVAVLACLIVPAALLAGQTHTITQAGKQFSKTELTVNRGDTVTFTNDDTVTHNVLAKGGAKEFNTGSLKPGESREVTFDTAGTAAVRCAIHPLMKLNVTVK